MKDKRRSSRHIRSRALFQRAVTKEQARAIVRDLCGEIGIPEAKFAFEQAHPGLAGSYNNLSRTLVLYSPHRHHNVAVLLHEFAHHLHIHSQPIWHLGIRREPGRGYHRAVNTTIYAWDTSPHSSTEYPQPQQVF